MYAHQCGLRISAAAARAHAPLVQRAKGIIESFGGDAVIHMRDTEDTVAPGPFARAITLQRVDEQDAHGPSQYGPSQHGLSRMASRIERGPSERLTLLYRDGASEATLAALLACAAPPGSPVAADPESLSVLALAERTPRCR